MFSIVWLFKHRASSECNISHLSNVGTLKSLLADFRTKRLDTRRTTRDVRTRVLIATGGKEAFVRTFETHLVISGTVRTISGVLKNGRPSKPPERWRFRAGRRRQSDAKRSKKQKNKKIVPRRTIVSSSSPEWGPPRRTTRVRFVYYLIIFFFFLLFYRAHA